MKNNKPSRSFSAIIIMVDVPFDGVKI